MMTLISLEVLLEDMKMELRITEKRTGSGIFYFASFEYVTICVYHALEAGWSSSDCVKIWFH